jgi:hypothetical protein
MGGQTLSECHDAFAQTVYFFFLVFFVFFAFFAFFAFLAMLPSVVPEVGSMQVDIDVHAFRVHYNCKIGISRFEDGKRPSRRSPRGVVI